MGDFVVRLVRAMGYPGIALLMFAENAAPPVPSEVIMPLAGYETARGTFTLWAVILAGSIGSFAGAYGWYLLGRRVKKERLRSWIRRHGRWLTLGEDDLDRAQGWFDRRGGAAVFFGRLIPGIRTYISLPAGLAKMHPLRFSLYTAAGTLLWTSALAFAGRLLADNFREVERWMDPAGWVVFAAVAALYAWRVWRWKRA
jgi:membrane protein DedA with SNARE-associated domain